MKEAALSLRKDKLDTTLMWATRLLGTTVWVSAFLFGLYILAFYFLALFNGNAAQWNDMLPGLYDKQTQAATTGIGLHFAAGGIILILGCIQLIDSIRIKYPAIHRWMGRLYVLSALGASIGGLIFIFAKGTIGGGIMDAGFTGYGVLTFVAAVATIWFARAGDFAKHRAWATRLFALAIGSWIYRMDYGFWFLFAGRLGHAHDFTGPFDYFMDFFFYLPNLVVAEFFIGQYDLLKGKTSKVLAIIALYIATAFLILATYFFTKEYWGPAIMTLITE